MESDIPCGKKISTDSFWICRKISRPWQNALAVHISCTTTASTIGDWIYVPVQAANLRKPVIMGFRNAGIQDREYGRNGGSVMELHKLLVQ